MFDKKMLGYVEETGLLGEIVSVDLRSRKVSILNEGKTHTVYEEEVEILKEVFELNGIVIYDKDVLCHSDGGKYSINLFSDGDVQLHVLNEKLETTKVGRKFSVNEEVIRDFERDLELVGNLYELKNLMPKDPTFNIRVVREFDGKDTTYFYACNNKAKKEIDLIKVIFVGHHILEEEEHVRNTVSYDRYNELIEGQLYNEVSPQELVNYIAGASYREEEKSSHMNEDASRDDSADANVESYPCDSCGEDEQECDCQLWSGV